ncbi:UNKNOWN [Stylonychia lemnae]|uniref:Uncharacterized protein n=1 Tax=Stylonychia lemnae TaxID=5949 RepID=A0A078A0F1_STYLE|nr:UNKNOWN [Stylonychia lemnae]|eukprot:CDW75681.1 UNKNOWN [Stylonychia lemnae]
MTKIINFALALLFLVQCIVELQAVAMTGIQARCISSLNAYQYCKKKGNKVGVSIEVESRGRSATCQCNWFEELKSEVKLSHMMAQTSSKNNNNGLLGALEKIAEDITPENNNGVIGNKLRSQSIQKKFSQKTFAKTD